MMTHYVNVYLVDRAYGGPEEGGWWYDYGVIEESIPCVGPDDQEATFKVWEDWAAEQNKDRPPIHQTNSQGRYMVVKEGKPGRNWPDEAVRYE